MALIWRNARKLTHPQILRRFVFWIVTAAVACFAVPILVTALYLQSALQGSISNEGLPLNSIAFLDLSCIICFAFIVWFIVPRPSFEYSSQGIAYFKLWSRQFIAWQKIETATVGFHRRDFHLCLLCQNQREVSALLKYCREPFELLSAIEAQKSILYEDPYQLIERFQQHSKDNPPENE